MGQLIKLGRTAQENDCIYFQENWTVESLTTKIHKI
jgi:hypothetical protein